MGFVRKTGDRRPSLIVVALALVVGACGGGDTATVTAVSVTPAEDPAALAAYLAEVHDIAAELVEAQAAPQAALDPSFGVEAYDRSLAAMAVLRPPAEATDFHARWQQLNDEVAGMLREFAEVAETGDPTAIQQAALAMLAELGESGDALVELDREMADLAISVLASRPDDPEAAYLVQVLTLRRQAQIERAFDLFTVGTGNPGELLGALRDLSEELEEVADGWESLDPPGRFADLQDRQVRLSRDLAAVMGELLDDLLSGNEPSFALITEIQQLNTESPRLNAEWNREIADVLRTFTG